MSDFEVCERGTQEEIRLARKVANEIEWVIESGGVMPVQIRNAYEPLRKFYESQVENKVVTEEGFDRPLRNKLFGLELWQ